MIVLRRDSGEATMEAQIGCIALALRLRGDFGGAREVTLSQRIAGAEVSRATGQVAVSASGEVIYVEPAGRVRQLPVVEVEVLLTAGEGSAERPVGSYMLVHGGLLHRS